MTRFGTTALVASMCLAGSFAAQAATTDTVQYPSGYFVDSDANKYSSPYYRWYNEDWGWSHNAIGGSITSATLNISAFDVDYDAPDGERDGIYAKDNGSWTFLGYLSGGNDIWQFTNFTLGSNFYDDIASGLEVMIDIDSTHNYQNWAVTLAKSSLSVDGGALPSPTPTPVPEPETYAMLLAGLGLLGLATRRRRHSTKIA